MNLIKRLKKKYNQFIYNHFTIWGDIYKEQAELDILNLLCCELENDLIDLKNPKENKRIKRILGLN